MKFYIFMMVLVWLPSISSSFSNEIEINNTGITFKPPSDFVVLSPEIISIKWPTNRAPKFAVGNKNASTTIAYDLKPHNIGEVPLTVVQNQFTNLLGRIIPNLKWLKNEIVEISGQKWIYFEMTSTAIDADIHNMMLVTPFKKKMLIFNFNSTKSDFVKYEEILRESMKSIKLPPK